MRSLGWFLIGVVSVPVFAVLFGLVMLKSSAHGFSAHTQPMFVEKFAAGQARLMALPSDAKNKKNPVPNSSEVLTEARGHWADHCAVCHGNDGSGQTEMGKNMYPPAPDMRKHETQDMTDGQLFYIIENGVRLSGMPAWGGGSEHGEEDSWNLVRFIRHLPVLSPNEIQEMEKLNPKTPEEREEEQQEEQFLKAGNLPTKDQHHH
ncbi:MAG: c-type cytochrome [Bryobacteraceae bacterium]